MRTARHQLASVAAYFVTITAPAKQQHIAGFRDGAGDLLPGFVADQTANPRRLDTAVITPRNSANPRMRPISG
jgi:hypothetical protein